MLCEIAHYYNDEMTDSILAKSFYNQDACLVARQLLGKIIRRKYKHHWLSARIIETEAYYLDEKGSHASLGYTDKRRALFMPAATIYMYYARGKDSFNISCNGKGNAVLIKSAYPVTDNVSSQKSIKIMQQLNPTINGEPRPEEKLCKGQTLLCKALNIKVIDWDQRQFDKNNFYIEDTDNNPDRVIQTTRLGIPTGRDEDLPYRFIDHEFSRFCTSNPLTKRNKVKLTVIQ
jgi:DNA-3-methyladenine glycosylase